ncbi:sugar ABC transporter ATP-binding protein [Acidithiobacillus sp. M4-SHS-6]|uniref:sugar ABC transporter ATP-binding protein n=1 Tax=Acidithiobacillus sp. M4-SHS-6 TaxID=3383024 RepID=UPI0039BE3FF4
MIGVRKLSVRFGPTLALDGVDMEIRPGTIHALAGENGSGKSTLLNVLGGALTPSKGSVILDGKPVTFTDTGQAAAAGVGIIFQELSLFPHLSGYSNIFIGNEPSRFGLMRLRQLREDAERLVNELGFPRLDLNRPVAELSVAEQQVVEILKCLSQKPKIVLFDEPTASLTQREIQPVLSIMKRLRDQGYTVVFVSHYLEEVFAVADRITVLRDGRVTLDDDIANADHDRLLAAMLGRKLTEFYPSRVTRPQREVGIKLEAVTCDGIEPISLEIGKGEILGVAGAIGSGSSAFGEMLGGLRSLRGGAMYLDGRDYKPSSAAEALRCGVAYVPEDRRTEALLLDLSVSTNISLPLIASPRSPLVAIGGFLRQRKERDLVKREVEHLNVRPGNPRLPARALSGGNQQKVVLARWFLYDRPCLVLNNPTKGVDVGSKAEIYRHIASLSDSGHTIILISNYNPEICGMADRVVVFREGRLFTTFEHGAATEEDLLDMTIGGTSATLVKKEA